MSAEARHEIENLMFRYAHAIDAGRFEDIADLFSQGRILGPDGKLAGIGYNGVLALYQQSTRLYPPDNTPKTQHVISNIHLQLAEDGLSANAEASFTVMQQLEDFPLQVIIAGSYRDRFRNTESGWIFEERQMLPRLFGDLSRHLLMKLQDDNTSGTAELT
jgi:3-phenylpropionate/cinnamic acid dioxygenase small subunit